MECNKDEAIRAKEIAEKKMHSSDFEGAMKFAMKAQRLFPELENMSQLLAICEVHCSALKKVSKTEMDWYGILQIEQSADEGTIKKQYRKLALLLHPDKNKFAGAEAAFKLVGEAHRLLADQAKRTLYDRKYTSLLRNAESKLPPHQSNNNFSVNRQSRAGDNLHNSPPLFANLNPYQQAPPTFWTCCPNCRVWYQYYKDFVNKPLLCQTCSKVFVALDLTAQYVPVKNPWVKFPNQNVASNQGPSKFTSERNGRNVSGVRFPDGFAGLDPKSKAGNTAEVRGASKTEVKADGHVGKKGVGVTKSDAAKPQKPGSSKNVSRKRGRKSAVESSETGIIDDNDKDVNIHQNGGKPSEQNSGNHRRSSRQRQNISSQENVRDDDDFVIPPKQRCRSSKASEEKMEEAAVDGRVCEVDNSAGYAARDGHKKNVKQKASPTEEIFPNKKSKMGEGDVKTEVGMPDHDDRKSEVDDKSGSISNVFSKVTEEVPDVEFGDFEKDKKENCFAVNQTWAIYDSLDGMPRFYARVKKVFSPGFKLKITWLEADPDDQGEIDWCEGDLPVGCGKFELGDTVETVERPLFSHQMHCIKGSGRSSYLIYPRKGETWALFKNWDIGWSSDPEKNVPYKFEFVEVVSEFVDNVGIGVAYLGKVKGFVSLFQQTEQHGIVSFQVPPNELYRFSHRIPSFRMTGGEKEGVPKGSFELDPAALPTDFDKYDDPNVVKMKNGLVDAEVSGLCWESSESKVEHVMGSDTSKKLEGNDPGRETSMLERLPRQSNGTHTNHGQVNASECTTKEDASKENCNLTQLKGTATLCQAAKEINTPKKFDTPKKHEKRKDIERESLTLRRSPRGSSKQNGQINEPQSMEGTIKHSDANIDKNCGSFTKSKGGDYCESYEKMHLSVNDHSSNSFTKSPVVSLPMTSGCKISEAERYDFNGEKLEDKFQLDQIWVIYSDKDGMPKNYAQVKKIESKPNFRLHVALIKPCSLPKGTSQSVCCGMFEVKTGRTVVLSCSAFSHRLRAEPVGKNRYKIYPRKGEVWALYKNLNSEVTCSDMGKGECDIVEVLEDNDKSIEVVVLSPLNGFKSVFKSPRIQRSKSGVISIPWGEIARFSHQIPAFQHSGERDIRFRGCWELDPKAVPGFIV
jgi:curved DNA-binding protein CbpA